MLFSDLLLSESDASSTEAGSSCAFDNEIEGLKYMRESFSHFLAAGGDQMDALTLELPAASSSFSASSGSSVTTSHGPDPPEELSSG